MDPRLSQFFHLKKRDLWITENKNGFLQIDVLSLNIHCQEHFII